MTKKKQKGTGAGRANKLKVRKETIKDLGVRNKGKDLKGGAILVTTCPNGCGITGRLR